MPSRSLLSVQEKLERRWRYVCEAEWMAIGQAMASYFRFVLGHDPLVGPVTALEQEYPDGRGKLRVFLETTSQVGAIGQGVDATSEVGTVSRGWLLFCMAGEHQGPLSELAWHFEKLLWPDHTNSIGNLREISRWKRRSFVQTHLRPLHEYLLDALDANVEALAAIRWFQQWAQWFGASRFEWEKRLEDERLEARRKSESDKVHRAQYEDSFQRVMFEKLFEYGIFFDAIGREPRGPDGRPDFVIYTATQRTSSRVRPVVVEAKVIDGETDRRAALGHLQIRRYMDTHHADTGYLVLFDRTEEGHHVELPHRLDDLPFLPTDDGRRVFIVHAICVAQVSASKAHPFALKAEHFQFELD